MAKKKVEVAKPEVKKASDLKILIEVLKEKGYVSDTNLQRKKEELER